MAYLSLYRKYRPQFFADVVGQDHVVQTLQNALKSGHIANGYLFCGTRGVAKTTMARILAKGLNCIGVDGLATRPQSEPCNVCAPCKAISSGHAVDVVELDAASNRSVNDIAKLRDSVQFGPMENRYKVYIVDEAHQLSSDAKDAFLKTLEEPPANVVFILATTETHAIPITIASRCQRFDFKRGSIQQIGDQVSRVLDHERVKMDRDAIILIARAAEGSYRDALSLLDQVLAFKRQDISSDDVSDVLGTVKSDLLAATIQRIAESDFAGVFSIAEEIFNQGKDVRQFLKTLAIRFRDMLFLCSGAKADEDQTLDDPILQQQAGQFSPATLLEALTVITESEQETRNSNQHRLLLEMALLKLTKLPTVPMLMQLSAAVSTETLITAPTRSSNALDDEEMEDETHEAADTVCDDPDVEIEKSLSGADVESDTEIDRLTIPMFGLDDEPTHLPPATKPVKIEAEIAAAVEAEERELIASQTNGDGLAAFRTDAQDVVPNELMYLQKHWSEAVNHMSVISQGGVPYVKDAKPISQIDDVITLEFTQPAFVARLENIRAMERLQEVVNKVLKKSPKTFKIRAVLQGQVAPISGKPKPKIIPHAADAAESAPLDLLDEVISVFGGRIIEDSGTGR
jgi:DNA polymerase III subunit gamma/tau